MNPQVQVAASQVQVATSHYLVVFSIMTCSLYVF